MSNNEIEACQKKYKELEAGKSGIYNTIGRLYFEKYKDSPEGEFADSVNQINKINEEMKQIDSALLYSLGIRSASMEEAPQQAANTPDPKADIQCREEIERDLYKNLYEQLLERVMNK